LVIGASVAAAGMLAVGAAAYDSSRDNLVADGVRVAGVDVGGLRASAARKRLERRLTDRLDRPVKVRVAGRRFRLAPTTASLAVDVDGMVDEALARSRSGGLPGRLWRGLTGNQVTADLDARVTYSTVAVKRFVGHVKRMVDRPPRDAGVRFQTAALPAIPSETGLRVSRARLLSAVTGALALTAPHRNVRVPVRVKKPKITIAKLGKKYPVVVTIDRASFKLRFFKRLRLAHTYRIAVGQAGLETPAGLYHVQDKAVNPSWHVPNSAWAGDLAGRVIPPGPDNPIKSRWLGIYAGAGIHGTADLASLGTAASHGCIRMAVPDVEKLYDRVPIQSPVFIQ
jgi:lipoprotein-anchoring transpeptidase ErfK/SrfK